MKIGFIGAGNMGSALAKAAVLANDAVVYLYDKDEGKAKGVASEIGAGFASASYIASECDYIFLAVKPNIIKGALSELEPELKKNKNAVVISMAAGVAIASLEEVSDSPIIRIMPNTPAAVRCGMILWCKNDKVSDEATVGFLKVMEAAGALDEIPEKLIDAASAVSGCGPAFVYMFIEALADGGVECGLPRDKAMKYAAETVLGAAEMVKKTGIHPGELKDAVCSPGGSTIAGVHALEEGAFRATAANAVLSAYKKTLTLGK